MNDNFYYNGNRTLTHNALFNFIVGERGVGKTYWFKKWAIEDFLKNGNQFGYARRYKDELKESISTFFNDVCVEFPDHSFKTDNKKFYIDGKVAGYGFVLSTAKKLKSVSYPTITKLCYDEFLIEKGLIHYLPDEVGSFLNLYETIARPGSDHPDVICFFLANAITWTNPYFLYFKVRKPKKKDKNNKLIWKDGEILIEMTESSDFRDAKTKTRFGSIISGTTYGDYSINNTFLLDDSTFIEKKGKNAKFVFCFKYKDNYFGVWRDFYEGKMWVSNDYDPSTKLIYAMTLKDHTNNTLLIKSINSSGYFKNFMENYKLGNVYFEDINIKNIIYEIIRLVNVI